MAKRGYKIPASLSRSILDHEIALSKGGSVPPIPVKVILFWLGSALACFWITTSTWVSNSTWYLIALVVVWWICATMFFGKYNKTKEMNFYMVPAAIEYMPKAAREVLTRTSSKPGPFYSIVNIDEVDDTGFIRWNDGTVGQAYMVVGSASILVFEDDKRAILDRVDAYWRKVDVDVEHIWITTKEPQKVWKQLANLEKTNLNLQIRDPELFDLLDERYDILVNVVGGSFNSIHQYLVLKAENTEVLRRAHSVLQAETEESSLMIRECTMLDREDLNQLLRTIYQAAA